MVIGIIFGWNIEGIDDVDGILIFNGIINRDEMDFVVLRVNCCSYVYLELGRVYIIWDFFVIVFILIFIVDIIFDLVVFVYYFFDGKYFWFVLILGFVILFFVVM